MPSLAYTMAPSLVSDSLRGGGETQPKAVAAEERYCFRHRCGFIDLKKICCEIGLLEAEPKVRCITSKDDKQASALLVLESCFASVVNPLTKGRGAV